MFANIVDLGFEDVLEMVKESTTYYSEMEDDEYSDLYKNIMNIPLNEYKRKMYFSRKEWPDCVYIRLDIAKSEDNIYKNPDDKSDVSEIYKDLSIKEIIEKVEKDEISFCLKHVFCNIEDDKLVEDHEIMIYHPVYSDLFAEDWCCYNFD